MRALIVDDEPPARRRVRDLLAAHSDIEVVGECGTAAEAVQALATQGPDLVIVDIRMPGGDGFEVVQALQGRRRPAVIFVTAFADHALQAWDVQAVDYLLKPFERERLALALERARVHLGQPRRVTPKRLPLDVGGRVRFVNPADVDFARAERNYVRLHIRGQSHLVRDTLSALERRLDPHEFLRIHRSVIVRLDRVREATTLPHGELALRLDNDVVLVTARSYTPRVRRALGC